eukprot:11324381-Prorocentrum_lima.AAC.1
MCIRDSANPELQCASNVPHGALRAAPEAAAAALQQGALAGCPSPRSPTLIPHCTSYIAKRLRAQ